MLAAFAALAGSAASADLKNVLFLIADDLRPQLNKAYGKTFMHTPNLDKFADTSLVFDWTYTNMAICSASRNSFMTGRVPDKTRTVMLALCPAGHCSRLRLATSDSFPAQCPRCVHTVEFYRRLPRGWCKLDDASAVLQSARLHHHRPREDLCVSCCCVLPLPHPVS